MPDAHHQAINLPGVTLPRGYSDATLASLGGHLLFLGGHVAFDQHRRICHPGDLVAQVGVTLGNLRKTLEAAGGLPEHLVKLTIHTTDVAAYRVNAPAIGAVWRKELGRVYPAMTLLGVAALFDEGAVVEIDGVAVLPQSRAC